MQTLQAALIVPITKALHQQSLITIMTFDDIDDKYVALQKKVLFEQGQSWDLNIHGWNAQNESVIRKSLHIEH